MNILVAVLLLAVIVLTCYCFIMRSQLRRINYLLTKRLTKHTTQVVSIELIDKELNSLAININRCLEAEEQLRLKVVEDEKEFKSLIANISHDLRTPLTAMKGYLQLLDKSGLNKEQQEKISIVLKRCEELGVLIEQFFEYAYLLDAKPTFTIKRINLTNLVAECVAAAIPQIEEKGLEFELDQNMVFIHADYDMTVRIVENLIRNGIAHGREVLSFSFTKDKNITLHVKNKVSDENSIDVNHLFERFYTSSNGQKSTGLGLSIVKMLAEQMGGKVDAKIEGKWLDIQVLFPM